MRRFDPYDNQCGEAEYDEKGVYGAELIYEYDEIEIYLNK